MQQKTRCIWAGDDPKMIDYHDTVWGVPVHDDQKLFAKLSLDLMQAGLSWRTILYKTDNFYRAFDNFDIKTVSEYGDDKISLLLQDVGIIRNKLKINAIINNANKFLDIQKQYGSFDDYIWRFVDYKAIDNNLTSIDSVPAKTPLSDNISKILSKHGFKFVGSTIIYAWMQAIGMINDHVVECFRHSKCGALLCKASDKI